MIASEGMLETTSPTARKGEQNRTIYAVRNSNNTRPTFPVAESWLRISQIRSM